MRNATLLLALLLAACSNYSANLPSIKPYKLDIQQGNVVDSRMMMQLRPGMSRAQVRFIMGTPLLTDTFHANRWDYLYRMQKGGRVIEQRHVILEFDGDKLVRVRGDVIPADAATLPKMAEQDRIATPVTLKPKQKEKGLLDRLKFWQSDEKAAKAEAEDKAASSPAATTPTKLADPVAATPTPEAVAPAPSTPARVIAPAPQADVLPAPVSEAEAAPKANAELAAAPEAAPAVKPATPPKAELKMAPQPADALPPEDEPSYFERMLEKIGF